MSDYVESKALTHSEINQANASKNALTPQCQWIYLSDFIPRILKIENIGFLLPHTSGLAPSVILHE